MQARPQERELMVRAMTQVLYSLKREHEEMLETINQALANLTNKSTTGVEGGGRLMEKINRIIQPENNLQMESKVKLPDMLEEDGDSTIAYLKKYNLLCEQVALKENDNAQVEVLPKRIFFTPGSKILKNKPN